MKLHYLLLFVYCIVNTVVAEKKIPPVTIDASVTTFDSTFRVTLTKKIVLTEINDTSIVRKEKGIVGETRVGRKKMASIVCSPKPSALLFSSVKSLLTYNGASVDSAQQPDIALSITIITFTISEISKKMTQTMTADIMLDITLFDMQNGTPLRKFTIKTQNSYSTLDTSKHACPVLKGALVEALREILRNIE